MNIPETAVDALNTLKEGAKNIIGVETEEQTLPAHKDQSQLGHKDLKVTLPEAVNVFYPVPEIMTGTFSDNCSDFRFNQPTYPGPPAALKDRLVKEFNWQSERDRPWVLDDQHYSRCPFHAGKNISVENTDPEVDFDLTFEEQEAMAVAALEPAKKLLFGLI
jgi:hypothetical protein